MKARVLSVYDEGSLEGTHLIGAKGLAIMVEVDGRRVLFDTGRRGNYLMNNLDHLGIPADSIDSVLLSHGHRDHTGGLNTLLEKRESPLTVYAHKDVWDARAQAVGGMRIKDIGSLLITEENREKTEMAEISGWTELSEHLFAMNLPPADPDPRMKRLSGDAWVDDRMEDETALVLMTRKGPVLICGCCHTGIMRALEAVRERTGSDAAAVIGGIHMMKAKKETVDGIAAALRDAARTPMLYLCHCTSPAVKTRMRVILGLSGVREFYVGTEIALDV